MKIVTVEIVMDTDYNLNDRSAKRAIERAVLGHPNNDVYEFENKHFLEVSVVKVEDE